VEQSEALAANVCNRVALVSLSSEKANTIGKQMLAVATLIDKARFAFTVMKNVEMPPMQL